MLRFMSLVLFTISTLIDGVSAVTCYSGVYSYYCSPGQSCGTYYGDCRGLPTYAIISIISLSIMVLSICIRCCIQATANNNQPIQSRVPTVRRNPRLGRAPVHSSTAVPVHSIQEDAPPSYAIATSTGDRKY